MSPEIVSHPDEGEDFLRGVWGWELFNYFNFIYIGSDTLRGEHETQIGNILLEEFAFARI